MTDRYERIRQALEGLRERCAQEVERITGRRRAVAAMINNEAVKPCEVAVAIRKIDVQQYYECALREIELLVAEWKRVTAAQSEAKARADRLAEALRELEDREQRDEALLRQALEALERAHRTAMEQTLKARIPECAEFAGIAQDLDFVVAALRERLSKGA